MGVCRNSSLAHNSISFPLPEVQRVPKLRTQILLRRFLLQSFVFIAELLAITTWLDTKALSGRHGLTEAIGDWGPWILRAIIVFLASYLAFGYVRTKTFLSEIADEAAKTGLAIGMLAAHLGAMIVFAGLSSLLC